MVLVQIIGIVITSGRKELDACYEGLIEAAVSQPQVFMHRDYHSANLMVLPEGRWGA